MHGMASKKSDARGEFKVSEMELSTETQIVLDCTVTVSDGDSVHACFVQYSPVISPWSWDVDVRLGTAEEVALYPPAPETF